MKGVQINLFATYTITKKRKNPENGYWKVGSFVAYVLSKIWRKGRILKMDIERPSYLSPIPLPHQREEKEESWKWILKAFFFHSHFFITPLKKRKNPENGYWKLSSFLISFLFLSLKKRKNPENGYWKISSLASNPSRFGSEEKEESWKWILKAGR